MLKSRMSAVPSDSTKAAASAAISGVLAKICMASGRSSGSDCSMASVRSLRKWMPCDDTISAKQSGQPISCAMIR